MYNEKTKYLKIDNSNPIKFSTKNKALEYYREYIANNNVYRVSKIALLDYNQELDYIIR